ncbi:winged helix-turn-helix transcriptional regulator [Neorhizobium alkalisoli]|uniref:HxlR family transcriptional regulator n=1 Tax=Neorhizobium alkalisoli TaxID=528178 RepID=A0A561R324_9HYPH|nr:helix-turn-helix domain-containing protein [Neorhizobium alkalisoli]TWF57026.1 HxlR family transcriptional regulator [Neorhizobium alkalisoli]
MIYTYLMDTKDQILEGAEDFCKGLTDAQDETAREILSLVADKWPLWVMQVLGASPEPVRFSRVMERVDGISQKVLTHTLRRLEREGLVTRTLYPQVPPRVEYALTPQGRDLLIQVLPLWRWVAERIGHFEASRARWQLKSE